MALNHTELQKTFADKAYTARIVTPRGYFQGFLMQEFSFEGSADWTSLADADSGNASGIGKLYNAGAQVLNQFGADLKAATLRSFVATVQTFVGTGSPTFNINLKVVAMKPTDDLPRQVATSLLPAVYADSRAGALQLMQPPFGYSATLDKITSGECMLEISTWFRATQLIIKSVNPVFSKEVIQNGKPLYADITVSMTTFRAPTLSEVQGWFL